MATDTLTDEIRSLTEEEREAVARFVEFLKRRKPSPFLAAVDEFIERHPELLSRLAQ